MKIVHLIRLPWPILCAALLAPSGLHAGFSWMGSLSDSLFSGRDTIKLEVLETGDTLQISYNRPFSMTLPADTAWNVCFSAPDVERCYEIVYLGRDTLFQAEITGRNYRVVETVLPDSTTLQKTESDTASEETGFLEDAEAETITSDQAVRLQKVLLRVRRTPKRSLGKSTVSAKMIKRMPGLAEADVIRSIQALPGVVASSDFSSKIYVRGGGADQNLFLLDNGVVYSPVHFFGLFSTFLVECLDEVDFYKGGFAPEYGNRLSSVLDIKSRKGGEEEAQEWFAKSSVKLTTFSGQAHTEGHQGDFRWVAAGRGTWIKEMLRFLRWINATDIDIDYAFTDIQGHVSYDIDRDNRLGFSFYQGGDKLEFAILKIDWGNRVYPFNFEHAITEDLKGKATLSYSRFEQNFGILNIIRMINNIDTWDYKHALTFTGIDDHKLTAGVEIQKIGTVFEQHLDFVNYSAVDNTDLWLSSLFLQDIFQWRRFEFTLGGRFNHNTLLSGLGAEPRLSLTYRLPADQFLDLHIGYYLQYVNSILFSDFESVNEFYYPAGEYKYNTLKPTSSVLLSAGYRKENLWKTFNMSVEGYFKTLNHLMIFAPNDLPTDVQNDAEARLGDFFKEGEGYSMGAEFFIRRETGKVFGGLSYTRGLSVARDDDSSGAYYPDWHQAHSVKIDAALNWKGADGIWRHRKKDRYLRSSMQIKYATGLPYTEYIGYVPLHIPDQDESEPGNNRLLPRGNRNMSFVPAYFRWDVKLLDVGRENKWNFSWTILNITDHKNIFLYFYDTSKNPPELIEVTQFPFFPILISYDYYF